MITFAKNLVSMEIKFSKDYLSDLYYKGRCFDKKHWFQPQIVKKYINCINLMESVGSIEQLSEYRSLRYEVLKGDKVGISSVRINDQYRIEFTVECSVNKVNVTICEILELSNHYN